MENEFENQEELEKALVEEVTGENHYPDEEVGTLSECVVALEWLTDMQRTIERDGVSSHDVRAVGDICTKLQGMGMDVKVGPALEAYGPSSFTNTRSMVNERVSQEGIGQAVVQTIKAWIQKLIDYVIKAIRWFRSVKHRDDAVSKRVEAAAKKVDMILEKEKELRKMVMTPVDHSAVLQKTAKELLASKSIKRNKLTAAAFGVEEFSRVITEAQRLANNMVGDYHVVVLELKNFLLGLGNAPEINTPGAYRALTSLKAATELAGDLMTESPALNFIEREVDIKVFGEPLTLQQRRNLNYEFILNVYEETADTLRAIKNIKVDANNPAIQNQISETVTVLTNCLIEVGKLVNFFAEVNETKLRVMALHYQYANKLYTLTYNDFFEQVNTAPQRALGEKVHRSLETFLRDRGI
jgi:hypothetical protein